MPTLLTGTQITNVPNPVDSAVDPRAVTFNTTETKIYCTNTEAATPQYTVLKSLDIPSLATTIINGALAYPLDVGLIMDPNTDNYVIGFTSSGITRINVSTGAETMLMNNAAVSTATGGLLTNINQVYWTLTKVGTQIMLTTTYGLWLFDPAALSFTLLLRTGIYSNVVFGADTNEFIVAGSYGPSSVLFSFDRLTDQVKVLAGNGADGVNTPGFGPAARVSRIHSVFRKEPDLFYFINETDYQLTYFRRDTGYYGIYAGPAIPGMSAWLPNHGWAFGANYERYTLFS